jgi:hypothetical protein
MRQTNIAGIVFDQQNIHEPIWFRSLNLHVSTVFGICFCEEFSFSKYPQ